ncbi:MAG: ABC transporter ATP-binding protein [Nitrospinae bacterium]|jgi:oligopeptide/dipeptide ABC transporter ATP-binding protein|nr:ABC transporter ATP-binding protein [Nitrospinota bacterium]MDA1109776.1 ABC transporter ATP-binding protein [Nitrospinota bacterium]
MTNPELLVDNLKVSFSSKEGKLTAVNGISYHLNCGETLAIVGESGCGKTVSALSILRLISSPPGEIQSGRILFDSKDLLQLPPRELREIRGRDIAMIFQDPMTSLNPVLTLGDQITEPLFRHTSLSRKEAWEKAVEILNWVEIPSPAEKMHQYPHQLSGGMRQRVMIAMALTCSPRILIADEPTTALDVLIQAQIIDLLQHIKGQTGMSILLITHDLGLVTEIAQRVIVMYAGEIVESGPTGQLFHSPKHPYTLGLKNSLPRLGQKKGAKTRLTEIPGNVPSLNQLPSGCAFHPRCPEVMDRCKTQKPVLHKVAPGHEVSCWLHEI